MKHLVVFAHGKESGPWGSKIKHLAAIAEGMGCNVLSPDYSDLLDPHQRAQRLLRMKLGPHEKLILVGSSMGGFVSAVASISFKPAGLFLMAPAFYLSPGDEQYLMSGAAQTTVVVGWQDEVIPVENSIEFARRNKATLHALDSGHRLDDVLELVGRLFASFLADVIRNEPASPSSSGRD